MYFLELFGECQCMEDTVQENCMRINLWAVEFFVGHCEHTFLYKHVKTPRLTHKNASGTVEWKMEGNMLATPRSIE